MDIMNGSVELKSEDIVQIKNALLEMYSPLIYAQAMEIIEPETESA